MRAALARPLEGRAAHGATDAAGRPIRPEALPSARLRAEPDRSRAPLASGAGGAVSRAPSGMAQPVADGAQSVVRGGGSAGFEGTRAQGASERVSHTRAAVPLVRIA